MWWKEGIDISTYFGGTKEAVRFASWGCVAVSLICAIWKAAADNYASKGKNRRIVFNITKCLMAAGLLLLIASGMAFFLEQPFHLWFPPSLCGLAILVITSLTYLSISILYKESEFEK